MLLELLVLTFLSLTFKCYSANQNIVHPSSTESGCLIPLCYTLHDYIKNSSYFTSYSTFFFLPGEHHLNSTLWLEHVVNVTLTGSETTSKIVVSPGGRIVLNGAEDVTIMGLELIFGKCADSKNVTESTAPLQQVDTYALFHAMYKLVNASTAAFIISNSSGTITNCSFLNHDGGAMRVKHQSTLILKDVKFTNNTAPSGGAIHSSESSLTFSSTAFFSSNIATGYGGALFFQQSKANFLGDVTFDSNSAVYSGGAMSLVNSNITVSGNAEFTSNFGGTGGALHFNSSLLKFVAPVLALFHYNHGVFFGGALYVEDTPATRFNLCQGIPLENQSCFYEVKSNLHSFDDINVHFLENYAVAGSLLFGGAIEHCRVQVNGLLKELTGYQFLKNISTISNNSTISSNPLKLCLCSGMDTVNCSSEFTESQIYSAIPGEIFYVTLAAVGQVNTTSANIGVIDGFVTRLEISDNYLAPGCNTVAMSFVYITSSEFDNNTLINPELFPYGCFMNLNRLSLQVNVQNCPNGFSLEFVFGDFICGCDASLRRFESLECDVQIRRIKNFGPLWIHPVFGENNTYQGITWSNSCPIIYCSQINENKPALLDFSHANGGNRQCTENRNGILCGACDEGYSLILGSMRCRICDNSFLSLIILFGAAGVGLIILFLVLNLTVASGSINGLILYANIVNVHRYVFFPLVEEGRLSSLSIFISWLNLDFGISTCFYHGLDAYQYFWFQYAFSFYLWFLTGAIILSSKYSRRLGLLLGSNPIAVLATVVLMSFTKILETVVDALTYATVESSLGPSRKVWSLDGNINYFEGRHILLGIAAICVIIFLLFPYVFLLTFGYQLQAYSDRKGFHWVNKLTPILDAYYAPYKKSARYWLGLMLVVRIGLFWNYIVTFDSLVGLLVVFSAIAVLAWANRGIYNSLFVDILEASFILNGLILAAGTYHIQLYGGNQAILSYVCTGVVFLELIVIFVYHIALRCNLQQKLNFDKFTIWKHSRTNTTAAKTQHHSSVVGCDLPNFRESLL